MENKVKQVKIEYIDRITNQLISDFIYEHDSDIHGEWKHGDIDLYVRIINAFTVEEFYNLKNN